MNTLDGMHVESVPQFFQADRVLKFDPACVRMFVGVRAIWLAWKRGRFEWLQALGLDLDAVNKEFSLYDEAHIITGQKRLIKDHQVYDLLKSLSFGLRGEVTIASLVMNTMYTQIYKNEYNDHLLEQGKINV